MSTATSTVVNTLAEEDPKIYIRFTDWRDQPLDAANNRIGCRVRTHAVFNNYEEIDHMFDRLVAALDVTVCPCWGKFLERRSRSALRSGQLNFFIS
jgi:hypothetical protein